MVDVLACPQCGGQVPLADGDSLRCPFCGAAVELPAAHRELRDVERRDTAARTEAKDLFARYGKKPSPLLRVAAVLFHPVFLVLYGFFLLLLAAMLAVLLGGQLLMPLLHNNIWDTLPDAPKGYGVLALAALSVLTGMALGVYGRRRVTALRSLQAALAATPPSRAGESAKCRECGAPLHVPAGAEGVRCAYCRADNLVDVPADWIAGIHVDRARVGRAIEDAQAWLAAEQRRIKRSLTLQLSIGSGVLALFITAVAVTASPDPGWRASWSEYVKPPRPLVRLRHNLDKKQLTIGGCERIDTLPEECSAGTCRVYFYAALRAGERFALRGATQVRAVMHSHFWWSENFGTEVGGAEFTAPWSAWYQLRVDLPEGQELCVK